MKRKLLLVLLMAATGLTAQTTHVVPWFMGVPASQTTITVEVGDTVKWTWGDTAPHTVTTQAGASESFNSGTLTGINQEYSHTFATAGTTAYACNFHPSMQGVITAEATAGVKTDDLMNFGIYPNPVSDILTIIAGDVLNKVIVYDMTGRVVLQSAATTQTVKIYMDTLRSGSYIVQAVSGDTFKTATVLKN